ncbi:hypothetical protein EKD04_017330 [Chloroflexales bacterium ZM16-3]|nr:hypothetical protein [Chloroflexales bacterium ZM16-3]
MGRFKNYHGMVVMHAVEGTNKAGELLRVERVERPEGSTLGVVWVRQLVNGVGVSSEQFGGERAVYADRFFALAAKKIVAAPAPSEGGEVPATPARVATPAPETVLLDQGDVQVVMVTGKAPRFEVRRAGVEVEVVPATSAWRAEQKALVARFAVAA